VKKLGLGGGVAFQWPLLENLFYLFYKMHFCTVALPLTFLLCSQRLCVLCFLVFCVFALSRFWIWIIVLIFFPSYIYINFNYYFSPFSL
jgi:hypothetical protein